MAIRVHRSDNERAALHLAEFGVARAAHLQEDVGPEGLGGGNEARPRRLIIGIGNSGVDAGAALNRHIGAEPDELPDGFRARRDSRFVRIGLRDDPNQHDAFPS